MQTKTKIAPGLVLVRYVVGSDPRWIVKHESSGLPVTWKGHSFKRKRDAVAYAERIKGLTDWTRAADAISTDASAADAVKPVCFEAYRAESKNWT